MQKYWFKNKRYGYGWFPCSWEGWLMLAVYLVALAWIFRDVDSASHSASDTLIGMVVPFALLTAILLGICVMTGEKPEWRWAGKPLRKK